MKLAIFEIDPSSLSIVRMMLELYPEAAKIPDNNFSLAIHKAAQFASVDVILIVHEVFPAGVRTSDSEVCDSSGVYICKSIVNYLRHGNYICKS